MTSASPSKPSRNCSSSFASVSGVSFCQTRQRVCFGLLSAGLIFPGPHFFKVELARSIINETAFTLHLFVDMDPRLCDCGNECWWTPTYYFHINTDDSQGRSAQTEIIYDGDFRSRCSNTYEYFLSGKANGPPPIYDVKISYFKQPDTSSYFFRARFRYGII